MTGKEKIPMEVPQSDIEARKEINESHPAITDKPRGQADTDVLRERLISEGYSETDVIAAMVMRQKWLEQQEDPPGGSKLSMRRISLYENNKRLKGILQGVRAALERPDFFKNLLEKEPESRE